MQKGGAQFLIGNFRFVSLNLFLLFGVESFAGADIGKLASLIGGFGFSGCCSGFGSGLGVGVPVGQPTPAEISDQYVASALIPSPPDYATNWSRYHVEVSAGGQAMRIAAPHPAG